jgi:hypothetical protein
MGIPPKQIGINATASDFRGGKLASHLVRGDSSEALALSRFRELQNRHKSILGMYQPLVVNTTLTLGAAPIWTCVRIGLSSRQAADSVCAQLEAAGGCCVVQRNTSS